MKGGCFKRSKYQKLNFTGEAKTEYLTTNPRYYPENSHDIDLAHID